MSKRGDERRKKLIKEAEDKIDQIKNGHAFHVDKEVIRVLKLLILELKTANMESSSFKKLLIESRLTAAKNKNKIEVLGYENKKLLKELEAIKAIERRNKKR